MVEVGILELTEKKLTVLLITALCAALRPPPGTRTPRVIRATLWAFENHKQDKKNENEKKRLSTVETCHLRGVHKINLWMNS